MAEVKVLSVPEGSIVWLHDIDMVPGDDWMDVLRKGIGHDQFVILHTEGDGVVEVLGPDELVAKVRAALDSTDG